MSHDPIGIRGGFKAQGYVNSPTQAVDVFGLSETNCEKKKREDSKRDRKQRHHSKSAKYDKHTKAQSAQQAQSMSNGNAQYWNESLNSPGRNLIEKEALRNGVWLKKPGGSDFYIYNAGRTIGYNNGNPTSWLRVEATKAPTSLFHGHPVSPGTGAALMAAAAAQKKCKC